jgi:FAD/FMN-containing dehydrogenase
MAYRLLSFGDYGNGNVSDPVVVGFGGWDFELLFTGTNLGGENRIYAVDQDGKLLSYGDNGSVGNVSASVVVGFGGWLDFAFLFGGRDLTGENRIYAYEARGGRLLSYGDDGNPGNVSAPVIVAEMFTPLGARWEWMFAGQNLAGKDCIYAVAADGSVVSYEDDGSSHNVAVGDGTIVGSGWSDFGFIFAGRNLAGENRIYATERAGPDLWSYRDDGTPGNLDVSTPSNIGLPTGAKGDRYRHEGGWRPLRNLMAGANLAGEGRIYALDEAPCDQSTPWQNYVRTQVLTPYATCVAESLADIEDIVRKAEAENRRVHAFGSKWSFSDCALTTDYVIDTTRLNLAIQTVQNAYPPGGPTQLVYHVEAGILIYELYSKLDEASLALETMGGNSGQILGGAISTGTHGGDKFIGSLADSVLAIHLVGAGGVQYWIEPTIGITDPQLLQQFVAPDIDAKNIIYDDATFQACLVSLGCMGVIYAVVLRVVPRYDLKETTVETTWQDFLESAPARLNDCDRFLQVLLDPYADGNNNNFCLVITRSTKSWTGPYYRSQPDFVGAFVPLLEVALASSDVNDLLLLLGATDESLSIRQRLANLVNGVLTRGRRSYLLELYVNLLRASWPPGELRGSSFSLMDTTFGQEPQLSEPAYSIELFFPAVNTDGSLGFADFVSAFIRMVNEAKDTFLTGYVAVRFTGGTLASLGMQQWKQTFAVEISVLQGVQGLLDLITSILDLGYQHGGLAHWGQMIDLITEPQPAVLPRGDRTMYPRYREWRQIYANLSDNFRVRTFENALSTRWRLTTPEFSQRPYAFLMGNDSLLWVNWWDGAK